MARGELTWLYLEPDTGLDHCRESYSGAQIVPDFRDGNALCASSIHDSSPPLSERACHAHARACFTFNAAFFLKLCHNDGSVTSKERGKEGTLLSQKIVRDVEPHAHISFGQQSTQIRLVSAFHE